MNQIRFWFFDAKWFGANQNPIKKNQKSSRADLWVKGWLRIFLDIPNVQKEEFRLWFLIGREDLQPWLSEYVDHRWRTLRKHDSMKPAKARLNSGQKWKKKFLTVKIIWIMKIFYFKRYFYFSPDLFHRKFPCHLRFFPKCLQTTATVLDCNRIEIRKLKLKIGGLNF